MGRHAPKWYAALASALVVASVLAVPGTVSGAPVTPDSFTATPLSPESIPIQGAKTASGRLAGSDADLLARTDAEPVSVLVKLDLESTASYAGGIPGLAATSPSVTNKKIKASDAAVRAYERHASGVVATARDAIVADVPSATPGVSFTTVYGGLAVRLPANEAASLLDVPGVVAVQDDTIERPLTDTSPAFIGATSVWPALGGEATAGEGVLVGVLDTGIWPEHPSFADPGIDAPAGAWACEFGDGSTELGAAFACNDKLVGAHAFLDTNLARRGNQADDYCSDDQCTARDDDGHGTHAASTAAGSRVEDVVLLGVSRGPIAGVAPGASVIAYRVCRDGCYQSDSVAAVQQAILDGVDVINFSISGGANPFTDPVELAFLDAFAAGISVNASVGNLGPAAATANHAAPWVTTVGAVTTTRSFRSTLTLATPGGATFTKVGSTVTSGVTAAPVIPAANAAPGYDPRCLTPLPADSVTGAVVVCADDGIARVDKGWNVLQGGAAGMVLANTGASGTEPDNHWLPTVHLDGPNDALEAFLAAHADATAAWPAGAPAAAVGDVMAPYSSRGPVRDFLKPDVVAPGVQILAGHTPTPNLITTGPPGELYQALSGTSMASPHSAGASALVKAAHPGWSPAQVKSALMTSAAPGVLKEDGSTPADPFDTGAGSLRVNRAINPTLTLDAGVADMVAAALDPLGRVDLNLPSLHADPLPGALVTTRAVTNVSGITQVVTASGNAGGGVAVTVTPKRIAVPAGASRTFTITIDGSAASPGWHLGQLELRPNKGIPVVLPLTVNASGARVTLEHRCDPTTVARGQASTCSATLTNLAPVATRASMALTRPGPLAVTDVTAPATAAQGGWAWSGTLSPSLPPTIDSITRAVGPAGGYLPLRLFGIAPRDMGDESILNLDTAPFRFGGETYTRIAVDSNGYVVVGGGTAEDHQCCGIPPIPSRDRPNNVIAPLWTDLDPSLGGGVRVATLSDGVSGFLIVDWEDIRPHGVPATTNSFQIWIQLGATERTWLSYGALGGVPAGAELVAGAENREGTSGATLIPASNTEWVLDTTGPAPGGSVTVGYQARSNTARVFDLRVDAGADLVRGTISDVVQLRVTR